MQSEHREIRMSILEQGINIVEGKAYRDCVRKINETTTRGEIKYK